jgi:hypothetical protein
MYPVIFSSATFGEGAQSVTGFSAKMEYTLGSKRPRNNPTSTTDTSTYSQFVLLGTNVVPAVGTSLDLTGATSLSFWAKATPPIKIAIAYLTEDVTDYSYANAEVSITSTWKRYTANFTGTVAPVFKGTWGATNGKNPNIAKSKALDFTIRKELNTAVSTGVLQLDDLVIHGWKDPNATGIRNAARPSLTQALRAADGKSLKVSVPAAYRQAAGTVAALDLSGKTVASAAFAKGQESVSLDMPGSANGTVFLRVFGGAL